MNKTLGALLVAIPLLFAAVPSHAGYTEQVMSCTKNMDGSGNCYGNFLAFRSSTDTSARAFFNSVATPGLLSNAFTAVVSNVIYTCSSSAGDSVDALWPEAMAADYFSIQWDANGTCTYLNVAHSSADRSF